MSEKGYAFFAAYLIGGQMTKEGNRKDVDLMIVTNMQRIAPDDMMWPSKELEEMLGEDYEIHLEGEIPSHYREGAERNKAMIRMRPKSSGKVPMDISYVMSLARTEDAKFINIGEFEKMDVSRETGEPLPRVLLYRALTKDITPPGALYGLKVLPLP